MDRRHFLKLLPAAGALLPTGASAYQRPVMTMAGPGFEVGVSPANWMNIYAAQQQSQWCWAACLQMLFASRGWRVDQTRIVRQTYGELYNLPAFSAANIAALSNRIWSDDAGRNFSSQLVAAYDYYAGVNSLDNATILQALASERPMILCNRSHAMLLVGAQFVPTAYGPHIVNMGVFDPWPGRGLRGPDLPGEFLAANMGGQLTYIGLAIVS